MKRIAMLSVTLGLLLAPGAAMANSTCQQYSSQSCSPSSLTQTAASATSTTSELPFTGLDVALLAGGGGTLLGAGLVVRRLSRGVQQR